MLSPIDAASCVLDHALCVNKNSLMPEEEACVDDAKLLTNYLFEDLLELLQKKGWTDLPLILYGHSFGARIAFSLAKEVEANSELRLEQFCPAAWCAPGTSYHKRYPEHMKVEPEKLTEDVDFVKGQLRCFEFLPDLSEKSAEVILRTGRCVAASLKMFRKINWDETEVFDGF